MGKSRFDQAPQFHGMGWIIVMALILITLFAHVLTTKSGRRPEPSPTPEHSLQIGRQPASSPSK